MSGHTQPVPLHAATRVTAERVGEAFGHNTARKLLAVIVRRDRAAIRAGDNARCRKRKPQHTGAN